MTYNDTELKRRQRENSGWDRLGSPTFFIFGCALFVMMVYLVVLDFRVNNRYLPNSCVVLDRRITSEAVDEPDVGRRTAYRPEIKIRYEVAGRKYEDWTYDAIHRLYNDQAAPKAIVDSFQVGATYPCWYDPDSPDRAILVRGHTWIVYVFLIIPVVFLLIGGVGIHHSWKNRGTTSQQIGSSLAMSRSRKSRGKTAEQFGPMRALRDGGEALAAGLERATVPTLDLSKSPGSALPYRLPRSTGPGRKLLGWLFCTLLLNGVTAPFVVIMIASRLGLSWAKPGPPWPLELVIILSALACLSAVGFLVYFGIAELLVAIGVGPTTVEISQHPLELGAHIEVFLAQKTRRTMKINSLRVACMCEEEATCTDRKHAGTETRRVYEDEILEREGLELKRNERFEARAELRLPRGAMHSFLAAHNQVRWKLVVRGDVARWPDFERAFPIVVEPLKGATK
jgi:hypothetical protein